MNQTKSYFTNPIFLGGFPRISAILAAYFLVRAAILVPGESRDLGPKTSRRVSMGSRLAPG
jgi:hypothetical protein